MTTDYYRLVLQDHSAGQTCLSNG